ncbi:hypothetical protein Syun_025677 [Stephania yunnanensis]|uniref:Uncharacterized protein n=1 Tax=Stephania yunnanensis TaxID=152371 RepID=A0AAP0EV17_9MAGN
MHEKWLLRVAYKMWRNCAESDSQEQSSVKSRLDEAIVHTSSVLGHGSSCRWGSR